MKYNNALSFHTRQMSPWRVDNSRNGEPYCRAGTATRFCILLARQKYGPVAVQATKEI
jgi:hypothetical protein